VIPARGTTYGLFGLAVKTSDLIFKQQGKAPHSRGALRPSCTGSLSPRKQRAQGMPGARCTRGLVCKIHKGKHTRAYRFSGGNPAFPARWFYGLFRALPGDRAFLPPSPLRSLLLKNLTPASGRQDHTTSPSARNVIRRLTLLRPPHPAPNVRDDREAPLLSRRDAQKDAGDLGVRSTMRIATDWHDGQLAHGCDVRTARRPRSAGCGEAASRIRQYGFAHAATALAARPSRASASA
jgi:hypothetical protein